MVELGPYTAVAAVQFCHEVPSLLAHSEMVITTDFDSVISCSSQDGPAISIGP
jgi:hypothetical protein